MKLLKKVIKVGKSKGITLDKEISLGEGKDIEVGDYIEVDIHRLIKAKDYEKKQSSSK